MKEQPKYNLKNIKAAFATVEGLNMTYTAMQGQYRLSFNDQDVVNAIQALTHADFYKTMPPVHANFTAWHDVYKSKFKGVALYIKFQINHKGEMIVSFKQDTGGKHDKNEV